jgi:putative CocE/NonD family hydrolase
MPDGCRLSARVWMPKDASNQPVPAILEYLPYRKRDGTAARDELTHPYFAGHGYACLRVDMRGNGDSEGLMEDEYSEQELQDACDVIAWIARQDWCSGKVGMMGISWGGFNALQVAAMQPPGLDAIITLCSTDDRYADDIHYKGGCLLNENLGWGATMLSYSSRPPDPLIVGEKWRDMWLERLGNEPFLPAVWLRHQTRGAYWRRGSVCEDFSRIKAATLAVGGWGDAYKNAVSRLVQGVKAPVKGIIGPWIHKYPHFAVPHPQIGFLQEALRWWDRWLKGVETGVENDPAMRLYVMDGLPPQTWYEERPGRWIAEEVWPSPNIAAKSLHLSGGGALLAQSPAPFNTAFSSPADCGAAAGEYCAIWLGPEMPDDQREDDAKSLCFDSEALAEALDIVGAPAVWLTLSTDKPSAQIAVRLCLVDETGASSRVTYGVMNLCHRAGHEFPQPLEPGKPFEIRIQLDDIASRAPAGHRLRLAISNAYWPLLWPSPERTGLTLVSGRIELPVRFDSAGGVSFQTPEAAAPWRVEMLRKPSNQRDFSTDPKSGEAVLTIKDDFGLVRDLEHGLETGAAARETWRIHPDDPLSATGETHWTQTLRRGGWNTRTETLASMRSDTQMFHLTGRIEAYERGQLIFAKDFSESVRRGFL